MDNIIEQLQEMIARTREVIAFCEEDNIEAFNAMQETEEDINNYNVFERVEA